MSFLDAMQTKWDSEPRTDFELPPVRGRVFAVRSCIDGRKHGVKGDAKAEVRRRIIELKPMWIRVLTTMRDQPSALHELVVRPIDDDGAMQAARILHHELGVAIDDLRLIRCRDDVWLTAATPGLNKADARRLAAYLHGEGFDPAHAEADAPVSMRHRNGLVSAWKGLVAASPPERIRRIRAHGIPTRHAWALTRLVEDTDVDAALRRANALQLVLDPDARSRAFPVPDRPGHWYPLPGSWNLLLDEPNRLVPLNKENLT